LWSIKVVIIVNVVNGAYIDIVNFSINVQIYSCNWWILHILCILLAACSYFCKRSWWLFITCIHNWSPSFIEIAKV